MYDLYDPRHPADIEHSEAAYQSWCRTLRLDPEDTATAIEYERACMAATGSERDFTTWKEILGD